MEQNNIISFSGGKDSTAMALLMLENGIPIHSVVAFDTGWEFPAMYEHWKLFEQKTGLKIQVLKPEKPFTYLMLKHPVARQRGPDKGSVHRFGYGWPSVKRRWCTRKKISQLERYKKEVSNPTSCIGIAWDEQHRVKATDTKRRYPLIEWGITEKQALKICQNYGFEWSGLYDVFDRVSCFCCPLQSLGNLRLLRRYYPEQWKQMLEWDAMIPAGDKGFKYKSICAYDRRFACEDRQTKLFNHQPPVGTGTGVEPKASEENGRHHTVMAREHDHRAGEKISANIGICGG